MDYLDSIDCSLEDFQAMLYGKQFSIDPDILEATEVYVNYISIQNLQFCTCIELPGDPTQFNIRDVFVTETV